MALGDARGTRRWHRRRNHGHRHEDCCDGTERRRIGGCHLEEQPLHQSPQPDGTEEPTHHACGRKGERSAHYLPTHRSRRRTERELDGNLARAAHDAEGDHAVEADGGQRDGDRGKRGDHDSAEAGIC